MFFNLVTIDKNIKWREDNQQMIVDYIEGQVSEDPDVTTEKPNPDMTTGAPNPDITTANNPDITTNKIEETTEERVKLIVRTFVKFYLLYKFIILL